MAGIVLDASVIIGLFDDADVHHDWSLEFLIHTTAEPLFMSALTLAEILVHPTKNKQEQKMLKGIETLGVTVVPLEAHASVDLARIRANSGLRMPDAILLHTAIETGSSIASADEAVVSSARDMNIAVFHPKLTVSKTS